LINDVLLAKACEVLLELVDRVRDIEGVEGVERVVIANVERAEADDVFHLELASLV
jgi:hypothetical protein